MYSESKSLLLLLVFSFLSLLLVLYWPSSVTGVYSGERWNNSFWFGFIWDLNEGSNGDNDDDVAATDADEWGADEDVNGNIDDNVDVL